ncbi:hypothetical protein RCL_jg26138.t1 [Rhizophagus clarus]|uniref:Uncharacterized protein n=1 Tax=Rhizophagus clarus TaxID=94130 RepID=A0A8H3KTB9_9GLOM|nr:hypothetical protein RCL_jg26138.t1 [Rhizophagus clarus]
MDNNNEEHIIDSDEVENRRCKGKTPRNFNLEIGATTADAANGSTSSNGEEYEYSNQLHIDAMIKKVTDSLPFNIVHGESYRKMINKFDPAFIPPSNNTIKFMDVRSNDGYVGVTLHWLTPDFETQLEEFGEESDDKDTKEDNSAKKDSRKLKDCMIQKLGMSIIKRSVKLLKPFNELTTYFSGIQYTTLSIVNPSIEAIFQWNIINIRTT